MVDSKNPLTIAFAARLTEAMSDREVTITDLHRHLGVSYEMARRYTMGVAMPRRSRIEKIADLVGKTAAWLEFGGEVSRSPSQPEMRPWPFRLARIERFYALSNSQRQRADEAFDALLKGFEAERSGPNE